MTLTTASLNKKEGEEAPIASSFITSLQLTIELFRDHRLDLLCVTESCSFSAACAVRVSQMSIDLTSDQLAPMNSLSMLWRQSRYCRCQRVLVTTLTTTTIIRSSILSSCRVCRSLLGSLEKPSSSFTVQSPQPSLEQFRRVCAIIDRVALHSEPVYVVETPMFELIDQHVDHRHPPVDSCGYELHATAGRHHTHTVLYSSRHTASLCRRRPGRPSPRHNIAVIYTVLVCNRFSSNSSIF